MVRAARLAWTAPPRVAPHPRSPTAGRVNPYMASPCHVEIILAAKAAPVVKEQSLVVRTTRLQRARRLESGAVSVI